MEGKSTVPTNGKMTGLKKHQQIAQTNKSMFIWVASASVIASFSIVASVFLIQQLAFNAKVIGEKSSTNRTLDQNIVLADTLKENINILLADTNLAAARSQANDSNLKVVLDALPPQLDGTGFGSSLQQVLLSDVNSIETLTIDSLSDSATTEVDVESATPAEAEVLSGPQEITFSFSVVGRYSEIAEMLEKLERSIRPIQITQMTLQGNNNQLTAEVQAKTFYQNEKILQLTNKVVQP